MNRDQILRTLEENGQAIREFGVIKLGIFGSYAKEENVKESDLDFLVEFDHATFDNYFDLKFFLERLFGKEVDLVIKDTVKPRIRDAVFRETIYVKGL